MRRIPLSIEVPKVLTMLMYTLLGLLLMTSAYFFIKTSNTAERGYQLRENQFRQRDLESENRILQQRVLDAQALHGLKKSEVFSKMAAPNEQIYVKPPGPLTRRR